MQAVQEIFQAAFDITNIWWLIIKTVIWFAVALLIIVKTDHPNPADGFKNLKSTLGFFLMFLLLSGGLMYLLFGQVPA